jgi:hypothetical protein
VIAVGDPTKQGNLDLDLRDLALATPSVTGTAGQLTPKSRSQIQTTNSGHKGVIEI